jgi:glycosyltransferase involved in cell wall biosynthesis
MRPRQHPSISLVICTRNRAVQLQRCLDAVAGIDADDDFELVLVDNGSTDASAAVIADFAATAPFAVHAVHQLAPGLSNARNAGVAATHGDIILFTDDDCYVDPGLLAATRAAFVDPAVGFASGRVRLFDASDYPTTINESTVPLRFPAGHFLPAGAVKGANLAFRRSVLDAIAEHGVPFDPLFGSGAHFASEDADAAMRASLAGWAGVYAPAIVVWHHHGRKAGDVAALYRSYDVGRGAFHAKLIGLRGGLAPALRAWAGLPRRVWQRPALLRWELAGAWRYIVLRARG